MPAASSILVGVSFKPERLAHHTVLLGSSVAAGTRLVVVVVVSLLLGARPVVFWGNMFSMPAMVYARTASLGRTVVVASDWRGM